MFAKLLKYEFRSVSKPLAAVSIGAILSGILGGLLLWLICDESVMAQQEVLIAVAVILLLGIFIALAAYGIGTAILLLYRFYKSKFSDEGYLTFTAPASTHQILLASILNIYIWSIISSAVLLCSLYLIFLPLIMENLSFANVFEEMKYIYGFVDFQPEDICLTAFSILSMVVYSLILPLLSITVGSLVAKKHKLLCAFAVGYGISIVVSTITGIVNVTVYLTDFASVMGSASQALENLFLVPAIIQLIIGIGGYFLMHHLIDKKLNI